LWSISVEEQFYLGWPLLLLLFGVNRIKQLAIGLLAVAVATRIFLAVYGVEHPGVWCNTIARLDPIALGAILAFTLRGRAPQIKNAFRFLLCGVGLVSFLVVAKYLSQDGPTSVITYSVTALASVALLVAVLQTNADRLLRFRPFSWLVYLGRISYGLYVFHLLALTLIAKLVSIPGVGIRFNFELRFVFSLLLTVLLAAASYQWLELPFLRLKKRFSYGVPRETAQIDSKLRPQLSGFQNLQDELIKGRIL
jgi:peptidoglycan/LPS O-acetylase OafA/YrhL